MKTVHKLMVIVSLLTASVAFATGVEEQAYIKTYQGRTGMPVPLTVVSPVLPEAYAGQQVMVEMVISKTGTPTSIKVMETRDAVLVSRLTEALTQWRFAPASRNDQPVEASIIVPVNIVDGAKPVRYASN